MKIPPEWIKKGEPFIYIDYCLWRLVVYPNVWVTDSCDKTYIFDEGGPESNGFIYCPYCGKPIKEEQK